MAIPEIMGFEFRIACGYLLPARGRLSRALLSFISIAVIGSVVWLAMVFLSISTGLQRVWIAKLLAFDAPIQIRPALHRAHSSPLKDPSGALTAALRENPSSSITKMVYGYADCQIWSGNQSVYQLGIVRPVHWGPEIERVLYTPWESEWLGILERIAATLGPTSEICQRLARDLIITELKSPNLGWNWQRPDWPQSGELQGILIGDTLHVPALRANVADLERRITNGRRYERITARFDGGELRAGYRPVTPAQVMVHGMRLSAQSLSPRSSLADLREWRYAVAGAIQGIPVRCEVSLSQMDIAQISPSSSDGPTSKWLFANIACAESPRTDGDAEEETPLPALLPKAFWQRGTCIGDRGTLLRSIQSLEGAEVERIPLLVCGFFDPGLMPLGGRMVLTSDLGAELIGEALPESESEANAGYWIYCPLERAAKVAGSCRAALKSAQLEGDWRVQTFEQFEHIRPLVDQLKSDQLLLSLLAIIITAVACSNIACLLLLLVFEKRREIAILRALGASARSVARIFGICGLLVGVAGGTLGTLLAWLTLRRIDTLVGILSALQGHQLLHPQYYGDQLPNQLAPSAIGLTLGATALLSLLAALLPSLHAARLQPSQLLKEP